jgi:DNA-binding response OmpR family regulator
VPQHEAPIDATSPAPHERSVLLVDDEAILRSALRRFFTRRGWHVCEAEDGERARALLLDGSQIGGGFDAIITDIRMPRLSGIELHDLVSVADPRVGDRFIFSSGDTGDDAALALRTRSQCPIVHKPFDLRALLSLAEAVAPANQRGNWPNPG